MLVISPDLTRLYQTRLTQNNVAVGQPGQSRYVVAGVSVPKMRFNR